MANGGPVRGMWSNGGRQVVLASLIFAVAIVLYVGATIASVIVRPSPWQPLEDIVPQKVTSAGPVLQGGSVAVTAIKCNRSSQDVAFESKAYYRNIDTGQVTLFREGQGSRPPGCTTYQYVNPVPPALAPGRYRIEGADIARQGAEIQQEPFRTEPFEVVGG